MHEGGNLFRGLAFFVERDAKIGFGFVVELIGQHLRNSKVDIGAGEVEFSPKFFDQRLHPLVASQSR